MPIVRKSTRIAKAEEAKKAAQEAAEKAAKDAAAELSQKIAKPRYVKGTKGKNVAKATQVTSVKSPQRAGGQSKGVNKGEKQSSNKTQKIADKKPTRVKGRQQSKKGNDGGVGPSKPKLKGKKSRPIEEDAVMLDSIADGSDQEEEGQEAESEEDQSEEENSEEDTFEDAQDDLDEDEEAEDGEDGEDEDRESVIDDDDDGKDKDGEDEDGQDEDGYEDDGEDENQGHQNNNQRNRRWGWQSQKARRDFPMQVRGVEKPQDWDHVKLRYDPDSIGAEKIPVTAIIRYIVTRGYLFVVLPSRNTKFMGLERAFLVKGGDHPEAKRRFINGDGVTVSSSSATILEDTDWPDFKVNNVASTLDGRMTLVEGYTIEGGEMKIFSLSSLVQAFGKPQAESLIRLRRVQVGQNRLDTNQRKKKALPEDVVTFLSSNNLDF
ncbi:unnamed protein product [Discula destructiva]